MMLRAFKYLACYTRGFRTLLLLLTLAVSTTSALSQEYSARPGDALDVLVVGEPDFSRSVTLAPDGTIFLPLVGNVNVSGLTIRQIEARLTQTLARYIKDPKVLVTFRHGGGGKELVFVLGQVARPGPYDYVDGATVVELLATSGGTTDRAAKRRALIIRRTVATPVDLERLLGGDTSQNLALRPGDVLVVPENTLRVLVLGEVAKPGYQSIAGGERIIDIIMGAGGPTLKAAPERISILREGVPVKSDLEAFLRFGDTTQNVEMQPGDIVYIPETERRVLVMGWVAKPGPVLLGPSVQRVMDAILAVGGPNKGARFNEVWLVRQGGDKPTGIKLDLWRFLNSGALDQNVALKPGDVVYVPTGPGVVLLDILNVLSGLNFVRAVFGLPTP